MTALAADRNTQSREATLKSYPVEAGEKIYKGALVTIDDDGYLMPGQDVANHRCVGVADENVDNTGGADGAKSCRVMSGRAFRFAATSITQAMLGDVMYIVDDQTFDDAAGVTNEVPCGRLIEFISTTEGWIFIPTGPLRKAGLTDSTYSANEQALIDDNLN